MADYLHLVNVPSVSTGAPYIKPITPEYHNREQVIKPPPTPLPTPISPDEFDDMELTAGEFDEMEITAEEFDTYGLPS